MNSLREWMIRMIPAGLDAKNKRDEWMEPLWGMNRMTGGVDGKGKTPRLNTLEGDPSEIEKKRALHPDEIAFGFHWAGGVNPVQRGNPSEIRSAVTSSISRGKKVGGLRFRTTWDIIEAVERGLLPGKIMLNVHPQRWTDRPLPWVKELVGQNVKNVIKKYFYVRR